MLLGEFSLENLTQELQGVPKVEVRFDIDGQRTLTVTARELNPQKDNWRKIVITNDWISKVNYQKEGIMKKTSVILESNEVKYQGINIYKKVDLAAEKMEDI